MLDQQAMFNWSVEWCNKDKVGYDQDYRNQQVHDGVTYYDCSSFLFFACWLGGGYDMSLIGYSTDLNKYHNGEANAWVVHTMEEDLPTLGYTRYNMDEGTPQPGDIMVKTWEHTEICYSTSPFKTMGARSRHHPLDEQVAIHYSELSYWDGFWRLGGEPPTPPGPGPVPPSERKKMPLWMMIKPYRKYGIQ